MTNNSTPHYEKLLALLNNEKLPSSDKLRVRDAIEYYRKWTYLIERVVAANNSAARTLKKLVKLLNIYKNYIDIFLIFDSPNDFLYRQKGQLKIDNTIIEEFLPKLINPILVPEMKSLEVNVGPIKSFSSAYFESSLNLEVAGGGLRIRTKDQDFSISKKLYLKASHYPSFEQEVRAETNLAYLVAECKTNLDKTMFQEGCATARDVKSAVPGAKFFLLCEWLDMTPLSTAPTDIDEVIILRKAKRISSNIRRDFSTFKGRQNRRNFYLDYLRKHPFRLEMFERLIENIRALMTDEELEEKDVLELGYF